MGNPLSVNYPAWGLHCFKLPPATAELGGAGKTNGWSRGGCKQVADDSFGHCQPCEVLQEVAAGPDAE